MRTIGNRKAWNNEADFLFGGVNQDNIKLRRGSLLLNVFNSASIEGFELADGSALSIGELLARGFDLDGSAIHKAANDNSHILKRRAA